MPDKTLQLNASQLTDRRRQLRSFLSDNPLSPSVEQLAALSEANNSNTKPRKSPLSTPHSTHTNTPRGENRNGSFDEPGEEDNNNEQAGDQPQQQQPQQQQQQQQQPPQHQQQQPQFDEQEISPQRNSHTENHNLNHSLSHKPSHHLSQNLSHTYPPATPPSRDLSELMARASLDRSPNALDRSPDALDRSPNALDRSPNALDRSPNALDRSLEQADRAERVEGTGTDGNHPHPPPSSSSSSSSLLHSVGGSPPKGFHMTYPPTPPLKEERGERVPLVVQESALALVSVQERKKTLLSMSGKSKNHRFIPLGKPLPFFNTYLAINLPTHTLPHPCLHPSKTPIIILPHISRSPAHIKPYQTSARFPWRSYDDNDRRPRPHAISFARGGLPVKSSQSNSQSNPFKFPVKSTLIPSQIHISSQSNPH